MLEQPRWRRYLRFWGPDVEADIEDELRFHLEMRERDFLAAGLPPAAAREEALARFGDPAKVARWLRDHDTRRLRRHRRIEAMSDLVQDARHGLRRMWQKPAFTLSIVLVLALGIGLAVATGDDDGDSTTVTVEQTDSTDTEAGTTETESSTTTVPPDDDTGGTIPPGEDEGVGGSGGL